MAKPIKPKKACPHCEMAGHDGNSCPMLMPDDYDPRTHGSVDMERRAVPYARFQEVAAERDALRAQLDVLTTEREKVEEDGKPVIIQGGSFLPQPPIIEHMMCNNCGAEHFPHEMVALCVSCSDTEWKKGMMPGVEGWEFDTEGDLQYLQVHQTSKEKRHRDLVGIEARPIDIMSLVPQFAHPPGTKVRVMIFASKEKEDEQDPNAD